MYFSVPWFIILLVIRVHALFSTTSSRRVSASLYNCPSLLLNLPSSLFNPWEKLLLKISSLPLGFCYSPTMFDTIIWYDITIWSYYIMHMKTEFSVNTFSLRNLEHRYICSWKENISYVHEASIKSHAIIFLAK